MMLLIELFTLNRAWKGLTDDEFLWEPMPGSWSVRPVEQGETPTPFIVVQWAADFDADPAAAGADGKAMEPLTSIAWLSGTSGHRQGGRHSWTSSAAPTARQRMDLAIHRNSSHLHDCRGGCRCHESGLAGARRGTAVGKRRTS
jgi:hypothetical protein